MIKIIYPVCILLLLNIAGRLQQEIDPTFPGTQNTLISVDHVALKRNIDPPIGNSTIIQEITYFIVASRLIRPGHLYRVSVTILKETQPLYVRASVMRNGVEISGDKRRVTENIPEILLMKIPATSVGGDYKLRVEGLYDDVLGGSVFVNESKLTFSQRSMSIFIQFDKPMYMQGQNVRFRIIPINTELRGFDDAIDVFVLDPNGNIMRRWLSRQSNLGIFSLEYPLADQLVFGEWTIRVVARGQVEQATFTVDEYYQTRFEVNVTMPTFFFTHDEFINGTVMANYTNGSPVVHGNLTLKASIRPLNSRPDGMSIDRYYHFEEELPFWFNPKEKFEVTVPHLKLFSGTYNFQFPIRELRDSYPDGFEIRVTATVGDKFLDEIIEGFSTARVVNSSIKVEFLGGSPQVFKPAMPIKVYIVVSHYDGSLLEKYEHMFSEFRVEINGESNSGGVQTLTTLSLDPKMQINGLWECNIDLMTLLKMSPRQFHEFMKNINALHIKALYNYFESDNDRAAATGTLILIPHYSPEDRHIKVTTSTQDARVDENIVFHIQSNFILRKFQYLIMSKGMILVSDEEEMDGNLKTIAIALSAEMAPSATIVIWHIGKYSDIYADSLTFPVNGISRNKFSVLLNNKKDRTGQRIEIAVYGEPGSYVGISSIDKVLFTIQSGNELTYADMIEKMTRFDEETNGTFVHLWQSPEGDPDGFASYPSSTFGVDVNRTFEFAGLVVFTNQQLPRRKSHCDHNLGYAECLSGQCYHLNSRCDGFNDCNDASDEINCDRRNKTDRLHFRKTRFNRIQRHYDNVWVWKDINIGPQGRYLFTVDVPRQPVHWMFSAFSLSPTYGFGMLQRPLEYIGVLPFFIQMEMPANCRFGEQIGIRIAVFNYMTFANEITVVLQGSNDYKFVHVEEHGFVTAYNARTSSGDHEFFVYIAAQDSKVVYMPIRPSRLGDIDVTVYAVSRFAKDTVTKRIHVESDGLPQYRHQSILLDLSNRASYKQYLHINVTETPVETEKYGRYYVFGSNKARISIVGDVVGPVFPTIPYNATSMLRLPMDSAEQNMFSLAVNIYTLMYMRFINQRNYTLERLAFHYMNIIYQRQLSFLNEDGSFSLFRSDWNNSYPSVWLTAYCADIFKEATFNEWENMIYINPNVISNAVLWVLKHQTLNGDFYEETWLPDRKVNSSDALRNVTLTAQVLIMLENTKNLGGEIGTKIALAQAKAIIWLERKMTLLARFGRPYDIAVVAYALIHCNSPLAETPFIMLAERVIEDGGYKYWGREYVPMPPTKLENQKPFSLPRLPYRFDSETIETTAFALLTYVARQENNLEPIVAWLNSMRLTDSGWASTHDTAIAMKALIEYTIRKQIRDVSELRVRITATALPGKTTIIYFDNSSWVKERSLDIPNAWGTSEVTAKGAGYALLQLSVQYNVDDEHYLTAPPKRAFDLVSRGNFFGRNQSHIEYISCAKWISESESPRSGLTVLDVTIPTGYIIQQQKLDAYVLSGQVRNLQRARFLNEKVVFYFNYMDHKEICVNLTVERWYSVANMSRYLPVRVYDYYAPERFNETMFDARSLSTLSICAVCGSSQCPYCPIFNQAPQTQFAVSPNMLVMISLIIVMVYSKFSLNCYQFVS